MNTLHGEIMEVATEGDLSLIKIRAAGQLFHSIVLDTPATSPYLKKDHPVRLLFKETEVILAKTDPLQISVRNQVRCRVDKIATGTLLCELTLSWSDESAKATGRTQSTESAHSALAAPLPSDETAGHAGPVPPRHTIRSIITRNACEQLSLKENDPVIALIKTNEVSLSPHD